MSNCGNITKPYTRVYNTLFLNDMIKYPPPKIEDDMVLYPTNFILDTEKSYNMTDKNGKLIMENKLPVSKEKYFNDLFLNTIATEYGMNFEPNTKVFTIVRPKNDFAYIKINTELLEKLERFGYEYQQNLIPPTEEGKDAVEPGDFTEESTPDLSITPSNRLDFFMGDQALLQQELAEEAGLKFAFFNKELADKMETILKAKYPGIQLSITSAPVWEQGDNVLNQEEISNEINFRLKTTDKILNNLNKIKQWESNKSINPEIFWRKVAELGIPKDQIELLKNSKGSNVEEKLASFVSNYSYTVEINVGLAAKERQTRYFEDENQMMEEEVNVPYDRAILRPDGKYDIILVDYSGQEFSGGVLTKDEAIKEYGDYLFDKTKSLPKSKYYSNLTVPGGTNYTEQEIATPAITPSIKGHAQFATDKGIGWFRSDDKLDNASVEMGREIEDEYDEMGRNLGRPPLSQSFKQEGGTLTKTRRVLEVQSDLFQKGRDKSMLIKVTKSSEIPVNEFVYGDKFSDFKTTFIKKEDKWYDKSNQKYPLTEQVVVDGYNSFASESGNVINQSKSNQFLQLLNKDNNWVTFFVKSIIQDSAKKGYEKVLFPSGNTASKVEGHTTLEEFKKQKEDRIKDLEEEIKKDRKSIEEGISPEVFKSLKDMGAKGDINYLNESNRKQKESFIKNNENEIAQLKQELERIEGPEGFGALKPIYNFYENTVTNILNKQYGKENVKQVKDEYGNTWNEVTINQSRDLSNVLLQRNEANRIIGQANIQAMTVLVDFINQKQDTLPHEYAHHYIAWFRNTPIVQEAIKKWGSEEALVQSIGEQAVRQKGEAWSWWKTFTKWVQNLFDNLSNRSKQELTNILTDAFLIGVDLENGKVGISLERSRQLAQRAQLTPDFNESKKEQYFQDFYSNNQNIDEDTARDFFDQCML